MMASKFTGRMLDSTLADDREDVARLLDSISDESERVFVAGLLQFVVVQPVPLFRDLPRQPLDMLYLANVFREIYREKAFLSDAATGSLRYDQE